jgi:hypothetical protein
MERIVQLLDDLDGLIATSATVAIQVGGILLARAHPPLAMALALILFVSLLYHFVTSPRLEIA